MVNCVNYIYLRQPDLSTKYSHRYKCNIRLFVLRNKNREISMLCLRNVKQLPNSQQKHKGQAMIFNFKPQNATGFLEMQEENHSLCGAAQL